jgi:hypothetical protein
MMASLVSLLSALALGIILIIGLGIIIQLRQQSSNRKKKEPTVKDRDPNR